MFTKLTEPRSLIFLCVLFLVGVLLYEQIPLLLEDLLQPYPIVVVVLSLVSVFLVRKQLRHWKQLEEDLDSQKHENDEQIHRLLERIRGLSSEIHNLQKQSQAKSEDPDKDDPYKDEKDQLFATSVDLSVKSLRLQLENDRLRSQLEQRASQDEFLHAFVLAQEYGLRSERDTSAILRNRLQSLFGDEDAD